jgi:hypothetical protein
VTRVPALMPSGPGERYDFFLSRRGSVASIAQEVTDVLKENGYRVRTQDYDIPITANFIEEMHEAAKNARDLVVLFTRDYEQSPYTRMEFTSFERMLHKARKTAGWSSFVARMLHCSVYSHHTSIKTLLASRTRRSVGAVEGRAIRATRRADPHFLVACRAHLTPEDVIYLLQTSTDA